MMLGMSAGGLAEVTHEMCVDQCVNLITYHSCSDVSQLYISALEQLVMAHFRMLQEYKLTI